MASVTFDTHEYVKKLVAAGFSEAQAEALSLAQKEALAQALETTLATKTDIFALRQELSEVKADIRLMKWMLGLLLGGVAALILKAFF